MKKILLIGFLSITLIACKTKKELEESESTEKIMKETEKENLSQIVSINDNPLMNESTLPYHTPNFDIIENKHFLPAFNKAMRNQMEAIRSITFQRSLPTFNNTIIALEKSSQDLTRIANVFYALAGAHTNNEIKAIQKKMAPRFAEHSDAIYLNALLFSRIKKVYERRDTLRLDPESLKLLENYYEKFEIAGANLSDSDKVQLKTINAKLASLQTDFNQILQEANKENSIFIDDVTLLNGLSEGQIKSMKIADENKWEIKLTNTTQQPLLTNLTNRDLRNRIYNASINRTVTGKYQTNDIVVQLADLRAQKGRLMGFDNYAEWKLQNTMAKNPEAVLSFFDDLIPAATRKVLAEASEIKEMMSEMGVKHDLEAWDWNYYAEKLRKVKYDLDEEKIKPYFELINVVEKGIFFAAEKLYGITYQKRTDLPTYHEDVIVYELFEEDGSPLGLFYGDFFSRDSKRGGAWMSNFVKQSKMFGNKPVIYNVCNNPKPAEGEPALLTYDQVETVFHEFGHALHGFFADQEYESLSGTAVARDFVEYPSQFNEYWALYPAILANYALHYRTGEKMPQSLVNKIKKASTFNQGYSMTEILEASNLDMQWHIIDKKTVVTDADPFETNALERTKLLFRQVPPRYKSTYFAHVFGGGYSAGYYSYLWTEMLMHDSFNYFEENGGLTRANGQRYRDMVLSRGNTLDFKQMYFDFTGRDPKIDPMLKARGMH